MVFVEFKGIVFMFDGRLPKKDEKPRKGHVFVHLLIFPNPLESLPSALNGRAVKQVVLGGFHRA